MKQENLDELKNIYLGLVTGGEGPEVLSEAPTQFAKDLQNNIRDTAAQKTVNKALSGGLKPAATPTVPRPAAPTQFAKDLQNNIRDTAAQKTVNKALSGGLKPAATLPAKKVGPKIVGPKIVGPGGDNSGGTPAGQAPKPAAPRPAAAPTKPMGGAPMDQFARANPTLAAKVKPGQSGYDTINTRLSADNDRGPSTPTPAAEPSGETDRLKKALDIKKSDVTSSYEWSSVKTLKNIADAYSSVYEKKEYETSRDKDKDGDNDFADNMIARMVASGMSREEAIKKVKNKSYNEEIEYIEERDEGKPGLMFKKIAAKAAKKYGSKEAGNRVAGAIRKKVLANEATAMAKRGLDEPAIRNKIASTTRGDESADKATALADRETYGDNKKKEGREKLARKQRGDFRDTTSSNPGLHGYAYKATTDADKEKQAARGKQRGVLTPNEKKTLNREEVHIYDTIISHLLEYGFADTEEGADVIIENMSQSWIKQILSED